MAYAKRKYSQSQEIYHSDQGSVAYLLKRSSARRSLSICVDAKARVLVSSPFRIAKSVIEAFLEEKAQWIHTKIGEARANQQILGEKLFDEGYQFLFLGEKFPIQVRVFDLRRPRFHFTGSEWLILLPQNIRDDRVARQKMIGKYLTAWYRKQAEEILGGRVFHYSRIMKLSPRNIVVRSQKRMWGCCHIKTQSIFLNWQIVMAPLDVLDYIVVHELCHLTVPNHSQRFWAEVRKYLPDFESAKAWLKSHYLDMTLPEYVLRDG